MLWIGIFWTVLGTLVYLFKLHVVWDVSRDPFNGGGVPTLDLPAFYPILISMGLAIIFRSLNATPFPFFGLALWVTIVLLTIGLMILFDRLGKPVRDAQSQKLQEQASTESKRPE